MKTTDFAQCLSTYLTMYLPGQVGFSANTIMAYRDTFKLVLTFAEEKCKLRPEKIILSDFNATFVTNFLSWLETERKNSISTRNQRLAALRAFTRYARRQFPEYLLNSQKIIDLKSKKAPQPLLVHLSADFVKDIIAQTDISDKYGRRDMVLLSLMYDSAARVQEICDLRVRDVRLLKPYTVILTGKGSKTRAVPIMANTAEVISRYVAENKLNTTEKADYPLFSNHQHGKLTRAGIAYILKKYCDFARIVNHLIPKRISPHILRHYGERYKMESEYIHNSNFK